MIEKEVYVKKLVNNDNNTFAYVMLEVRKTNYLDNNGLVLVTKDGCYIFCK